LKLLLDTHHSRLAADRLRGHGRDVTAAADDPVLAALPDEELLRLATQHGRALVTENAKDFDRIVRSRVHLATAIPTGQPGLPVQPRSRPRRTAR